MAGEFQVPGLVAGGENGIPGENVRGRDGAEDIDGIVEAVAASVELDKAVGEEGVG